MKQIPNIFYGIPVLIHETTQTRSYNAVRLHQSTHQPFPNPTYAHVEQSILDGYACWTNIDETKQGLFTLTLHCWDSMSDPIGIMITKTDSGYRASNAGAIAGLLFSLDHHEENPPAITWGHQLPKAHTLTINHREGDIFIDCTPESFYDTIADSSKVVIAALTVVQHPPTSDYRQSWPHPHPLHHQPHQDHSQSYGTR